MAIRVGVVQHRELSAQDLVGPTVEDGVMKDQEQHVPSIGEASETNPIQRALGQIEGCPDEVGGPCLRLLLLPLRCHLLEVQHVNGNRPVLLDHLHRLAAIGVQPERRAQRLVAPDDLVEAALQGVSIERALKLEVDRRVVEPAIWDQLAQKPETELREGYRVHAGARSSLPEQSCEQFPPLRRGKLGARRAGGAPAGMS